MIKRIIGAVAVGLVSLGLIGPAHADPVEVTRSSEWRALAVQALTTFEAAPPPTQFKAMIWSYQLLAIGRLYGWDDPRIQPIIANLMADRNPDGGWGIDIPRAGLNGTGTNPATTTYTVTLAGHVFPALKAAYEAGVFTNTQVFRDITTLLMSTAQLNTPAGVCIAYSRSAYDTGSTGYCVHNVSVGAVAALSQLDVMGFGATGLQTRIVNVTRREVATYNTGWHNWTYQESRTTVQDPDHGAYSARSVADLAWPIGREAAYIEMVTNYGTDDGTRGHMALTAMPDGPGSHALNGENTTQWCQMGDQWLPEATTYISLPNGDPMRLAQAAGLAAANADACAIPDAPSLTALRPASKVR
jgi:hypothetical protein